MKKFLYLSLITLSSTAIAGNIPEAMKKFVNSIPKSFHPTKIESAGKTYKFEMFKIWFRDDLKGIESPGIVFYNPENNWILAGTLLKYEGNKQINISKELSKKDMKYIHYDLSKIDKTKCIKLGNKGTDIIAVVDPAFKNFAQIFPEMKKLSSRGKATFYLIFYPRAGKTSEEAIAYILSEPGKEIEKLQFVLNNLSDKQKFDKEILKPGKELLKKKEIKSKINYFKKIADEYKAYIIPTFFLPDGTKEVLTLSRVKDFIETKKHKGGK